MLRPANQDLAASERRKNWLLQIDENERDATSSVDNLPSLVVAEWKELPVRNRILQDISARRERERRPRGLPSHVFAPDASLHPGLPFGRRS